MQRVLEKQPVPRPSLLGKSRLRGDVIVQVLINEYGKVDCIRAIKGHPLAISSAVDCVSKWVFKPYSGNGQMTKCVLGTLIIPYDFGR
jgi:outer membrane biosynthesis protein TonB